MFNNPFDSFHDSVAEAKAEREQLDRLLIISTPRERLLVMAIGFVTTLFALWLLFAPISQDVAVNCSIESLAEGADGHARVSTGVVLQKDQMTQIAAGTTATLEVAMADGTTEVSQGTVESMVNSTSTVSTNPIRGASGGAWVSLDIKLQKDISPSRIKSELCRLTLNLGSRTPISIFSSGRI